MKISDRANTKYLTLSGLLLCACGLVPAAWADENTTVAFAAANTPASRQLDGAATDSGPADPGAALAPPHHALKLPPRPTRLPVMPPAPSHAPQALSAEPSHALRPATLALREVLERNLAARGGLAAWRDIAALSMEGKLDAGRERPVAGLQPTSATIEKADAKAAGKQLFEELHAGGHAPTGKMIQLPFRMVQERGRKQRIEVDFQGQTAVQVYDGKQGWKVRPFLGRHVVEAFNAEQAKLAEQQQDLDGALIDYQAKGTRIALEGMEDVEGRPAFRLRLTLKGDSVRTVWVDAETFLETKLDGSRQLDGHAHAVATYLRDWHRVGKVLIPYTTETEVEGVPGRERIEVASVTLNPALDEGSFSKPE